MVAGFGSRLREKIDSIRPSTTNSSSSSSLSSPWGGGTGGAFSSSGGSSASNSANIRGLTRLGGGGAAASAAAVSSSGTSKKTVGAATTCGTSRGGGVGGTATSAATGTGSGGSQGGKNSGTPPLLPSSSSSAAAAAASTTLSQPVLPSGGLLRGRTAAVATGSGFSATGTVSEGALQQPLAPPPPSPREHNATATTNSTTTIPTTATTTNSSSLLKTTATTSRGGTTAKSPLPLHMPALGGSKIVPGWGAATATSASTSTTASMNTTITTAANYRTHHPHAPSGHLVGLHTHNNNNNNTASTTAASSAPPPHHHQGGGGTASTSSSTNIDYAPSTALSGTSPLSMTTTTTFSRRRRWGDEDEEEDSDETEFPNLASSLGKDGTMKKKKTQQQQGAHVVSTATTTSSYRGGGGGGGEQNSSSRWQHAHLGVGVGGSHYRLSSGGGVGGGGESGRFYTGEYDRHDSWRNNNDSTSRTATSTSLGGFQYSSRDYNNNNNNNNSTTPTYRSSPGGNIHGGYYSDRGGGSGGGGFSSSSYYDNGQYRDHRDYNRDSWSKSRVHNWRSSSSNDHEDHHKFSSSNWRSASSSMRIDETAGHANNTNTSNSSSLWSFTQREQMHISGSNNARHGGTEDGGGGGGRFDRDGESSRGGNNSQSFFSSPQGIKASDLITERKKGALNSDDAASLSALVDRSTQLGPTAASTQRDEASTRTRRPQSTSEPTTMVRQSSTPMVLLRSNNSIPSRAQTPTELASMSTEATTESRSADGASEGTLGVPSAKLEKLDSFPSVRGNSSQPPNAWATVSPTTTSVSDNKSSDASEGIHEVSSESSVATTARANPPSTETTDPKDTEQDRIDLAKEQQQNVLRQVAERRAAAVASSSKSDVKIERNKPEKELSPSEGGDGKEEIQPFATTTDDRTTARKGRFDIDRTDTKSNPKSDSLHRGVKVKSKPRPNPCRIDGHDHPWSDCPQNPKSEKFVRDNPCRIDGHDHDWSDCPDNPKSDNYVKPTYKKGKSRDPKSLENIKDSLAFSEAAPKEKGNPCRIDGHDHDWKDCTDNPKSINFVKKKGKGRGPKSAGSKKDSSATSEEEEEECKADNTNQEVVAEPVKELPEPTEAKVTPAKPKPFVPAPPPAVPAWTKANPLTIGSPPPATTPEVSYPDSSGVSTATSVLGLGSALPPSHIRTQVESIQRQLLETKLDHATVNTSSLLAPSRTDLSLVATTPQEIAAKQRALFDGNTALFGKAELSSVYDSWNTPQIGMANASIGLWRQTPFAPTATAMSPLAGQFGSTWSASAASLAQPQRRESLPTESKEKSVAPAIPVESVTVDDHVKTSEKGSETEDDIKARSIRKSGMTKRNDYPSYRRQRKSFQGSGDREMSNSKDAEEGTDETAVENDVKVGAKPATKTPSSRRHLPKSAAAQKGKSKGQVVDGINGTHDAVATKKMTSHHRRTTFAGKGKSKGIVESRGNNDAAVSDVVGTNPIDLANFKPSTDTTSSSPGEGQNEQEASHIMAPINQDGTKSGTNRTKRPPKKFGGGGRGKNNNYGTRPPRKLEDNGITSATATTKEGESQSSHLASGERKGNRKASNHGGNGGTMANSVHEN